MSAAWISRERFQILALQLGGTIACLGLLYYLFTGKGDLFELRDATNARYSTDAPAQ